MTRLLLPEEQAPIGQNCIAFSCDNCERRAPCRDPERVDRWLPDGWLETVPTGWREWASVDEDPMLHWCRRCAAQGQWEGQPPDLDGLPETRAIRP